MHDVRKLLDVHERLHLRSRGIAYAVDVVTRQIHQHDMLGLVLDRTRQLRCKLRILFVASPALHRTRNRVHRHLARLDLAQRFRRGSHQLAVAAVDVEHVGRRVDLAKMSVAVECVQRGPARESLRGHRLDDIALDNVLAQRRDKALVSGLAHVRHGLLARKNGRLLGQRCAGAREHLDEVLDLVVGLGIQRLDIGGRGVAVLGGQMHVADAANGAEDVVKDDERVGDHEDALGDAEHVLEIALGAWLKVLHAVVADVADRTARERRQALHGDVLVRAQLLLDHEQRVALCIEPRSSADDLERVGADERVAADLLSAGDGLEEERATRGVGAIRELEVCSDGREQVGGERCVDGDDVALGLGREERRLDFGQRRLESVLHCRVHGSAVEKG
ncbi:hypothetical protein L1887_56458 [Cichorium endivia]|nr:hypothetical protein L1887_56458 [Cichorium endivia]